MRHRKQHGRLGRSRSERIALVQSLSQALLRHERITTTLPKAKEAQRAVERLITKARAQTLSARRQVNSRLQDKTLVTKLFSDIAVRFKDRSGGYTRLVHSGVRSGDGAALAVLELVDRQSVIEPKPVAKPKPSAPLPTSEKPASPEKPKKEEAAKEKPGGFLSRLRKYLKGDREARG